MAMHAARAAPAVLKHVSFRCVMSTRLPYINIHIIWLTYFMLINSLQVVKQTIAANTINKAVGRKLLNQLPFWQTFTARLKSFALLYAIYTTIWVSGT